MSENSPKRVRTSAGSDAESRDTVLLTEENGLVSEFLESDAGKQLKEEFKNIFGKLYDEEEDWPQLLRYMSVNTSDYDPETSMMCPFARTVIYGDCSGFDEDDFPVDDFHRYSCEEHQFVGTPLSKDALSDPLMLALTLKRSYAMEQLFDYGFSFEHIVGSGCSNGDIDNLFQLLNQFVLESAKSKYDTVVWKAIRLRCPKLMGLAVSRAEGNC